MTEVISARILFSTKGKKLDDGKKQKRQMGKSTLGLSQKAYYYNYSGSVCSLVIQPKIELGGNLTCLDGLIRALIRTRRVI